MLFLSRTWKLYLLALATTIISVIGYNIFFSNSRSYITPPQPACQPLLKNQDHHKVKIDGELYPKQVLAIHNTSLNFHCLNQQTKKPLILLWNYIWPSALITDATGSYAFKADGCPVTNCETTYNKSLINKASLVVVHANPNLGFPSDLIDMLAKYPLPKSARTVYFNYESPMTMNIDGSLARLNDFFNLTATYKHGTDFDDIYSGEGVVWKHNAGFDRDFDFHGQKNRGVQSVRNLGDFVFCVRTSYDSSSSFFFLFNCRTFSFRS